MPLSGNRTIPLQRSHDLSAMDTRSQQRNQTRCLLSFKGAMTFQPWIRPFQQGPHNEHWSFKGAMTFQPWIRLFFAPFSCENSGLQRSHDLSAMDTDDEKDLTRMSTQPLQRSHDLSAMDTIALATMPRPLHARFKGAMTFQPWILGMLPVKPNPPNHASKEP